MNLLGIVVAASLFAGTDADELEKAVEKHTSAHQELYRWFHENPELSQDENNTAKRLARELGALGLDVTEGVGGTGVVAVLSNGKGPTVLVRADMDALPIDERTGLKFASSAAGVMHACGHDLHMTMLVGVAAALIELNDQWKGTIVFVGQPAEETGKGAAAMIRAGLFAKFPKPDYGFAMHVDPAFRVGTIAMGEGYVLASADAIDITVFGRGGHGAAPHLAIDPVLLSAEIITSLQTLVSRTRNPSHDAVLTVGSIRGGTKHNIIPDEVKLQLTLRAYDEETRADILDGITRISTNLAKAAGAPKAPAVKIVSSTPALYNDPKLTQRVRRHFVDVFGDESLAPQTPEMYAEDFAVYTKRGTFPTLYFFVGAQSGPRRTWHEAHTARFAPDFEGTYTVGVRAMVESVLLVSAGP